MFLSLSPKIRQACSALSKDELKKDDGLDKLITKLRELYGVSNEQATFSAYEKFETFRRSEGMNINDYINEFEQLNQKLVTYKIELPSAVRAYQLLKNANLPKEKRDLARATVPDLTYESMKKQIKAIMISAQQVRIKRLNLVEMKFRLILKCIVGKVEVHGVVVLSVAILEVVVLTFAIVTPVEVSVPTRQEGLYLERVTGILLVEMGDQHNVIRVDPSIIGFLSVLTALKIRNRLPRKCILAT